MTEKNPAIEIDANFQIHRLAPCGQLGDVQFLDSHHPGLPGYLILSQEVLNALATRRLLALSSA